MPRIRSIKPDHWSDKNLPDVSLQAHLLWIGLWNFSDDKGVVENDPLLIKSQIFPRRKDVRVEQIEQWLGQLVSARFLVPFSYNGIGYYVSRTFTTHQKIDKASPSKIPLAIINQAIISIREPFDDRSGNGRSGEEGRGEGEEGSGGDEGPPQESTPPPYPYTPPQGSGIELPDAPKLADVEFHFVQNGQTVEFAKKFYNHYDAVGWKAGNGAAIVRWKAIANNWIAEPNKFAQPAGQPPQNTGKIAQNMSAYQQAIQMNESKYSS